MAFCFILFVSGFDAYSLFTTYQLDILAEFVDFIEGYERCGESGYLQCCM